MTVDLLMEPEIRRRTIVMVRVAGVKDPQAIRFPGRAAAPGGILDPWNTIGQGLQGFQVVKMQGALLAAVFRQADRHAVVVRRWRNPIDGHMAFGLQFVGIEQDPLRDRMTRRCHCQHDQQALLFRWLELEGNKAAWSRDESAIGMRDLVEHCGQFGKDPVPALDALEMTPRAAFLGFRPSPYGGIIAIFQPTELSDYLGTMMDFAGRTAGI